MLTPADPHRVICGFIIIAQEKLIALLTIEILRAVNVLESLCLLLLHPLRKLTSRMIHFMSNPPSIILVICLANVVVFLTQSLHELSPRGKHFDNCVLSSPVVQSEQNLEGMSSTCA